MNEDLRAFGMESWMEATNDRKNWTYTACTASPIFPSNICFHILLRSLLNTNFYDVITSLQLTVDLEDDFDGHLMKLNIFMRKMRRGYSDISC